MSNSRSVTCASKARGPPSSTSRVNSARASWCPREGICSGPLAHRDALVADERSDAVSALGCLAQFQVKGLHLVHQPIPSARVATCQDTALMHGEKGVAVLLQEVGDALFLVHVEKYEERRAQLP